MLDYHDIKSHGFLSRRIQFVCYVCGCSFDTMRNKCFVEVKDMKVSWSTNCPDCGVELYTTPESPASLIQKNNTIASMMEGKDDGK